MLRNMKVTVIPIIIDALGTVHIGLVRGLEEMEIGKCAATIQATAFLRSARKLRRLWEI